MSTEPITIPVADGAREALRDRDSTISELRSAAQWAARALRMLATTQPTDDLVGCWCGRHYSATYHGPMCISARAFFEVYNLDPASQCRTIGGGK